MTAPDTRPAGIPGAFRELLGYRTLDWREGYGSVTLVIRHDHLNRLGHVHGGVYATLLDAAFGHAVAWCPVAGHVRKCVTVSMTVTYLQGTDGGVLTSTAKLLSTAGRLATTTGEVRDAAGTVCALGQASFMYMPGSERLEGVPRG